MYVAVRDATLSQAGYSTITEGLEALDLNAVELAVSRDLSIVCPDTSDTDPRCPVGDDGLSSECRAAFDRVGIHISGLLLANNFNAFDIDSEVRWVADAVSIADCLGCDCVRIDAAMTGQQEMPLEERIDVYASAVLRVLEATSDSNMPLGIENHGVQGNQPEWLAGVLDAVDSPRLGLTLDTGNFYWAGQPIDDVYAHIEQFAPYVKHVHCKNISFEPDRRNIPREPGWGYGEHVCPIPDGDVDHARVARILHNAGYTGGLNIEDESLSKFEGDDRRHQLLRDADHLAAALAQVPNSRNGRKYSGM